MYYVFSGLKIIQYVELFKIHQAEGNITGMEQTATSILRKSIKVDSPEVRHILSEINKFILNLQHK